jgi:hypothetical protein
MSNKDALSNIILAYAIRPIACTPDVRLPGTNSVISIEEGISPNDQTSLRDSTGLIHGPIQGVYDDGLACGEGEVREEPNASSFEKYLYGRNAPYSLRNPYNRLISQQMRAPSERTTPHSALKSHGFFRRLLSEVTILGLVDRHRKIGDVTLAPSGESCVRDGAPGVGARSKAPKPSAPPLPGDTDRQRKPT